MRKRTVSLLLVILACLGVGWTQQAESFKECSKKVPGDRIPVSPGVLEKQVVSKVLPDASDLKSAPDSDVQIIVLSYNSEAFACASAVKGNPALFERSENAVRKWKVRPFLLDGAPIAMVSRFIFRYHKGKVSARFED